MQENWPKIAGVYRIWLSPAHYYIGRATNCRVRWLRHLADLRKGSHPNPHMQSVFDLRGEFTPEVVVSMLPGCTEFMVEAEQMWLDDHYGQSDCVNTSKSAVGVMTGRKWTSEQLAKRPKLTKERQQKMAEGRRGRVVSDATRKKLSSKLRGKKRPDNIERNKANAGWKHTDVAREKIAEANRLRVYSPHTTETKTKISRTLRGRS